MATKRQKRRVKKAARPVKTRTPVEQQTGPSRSGVDKIYHDHYRQLLVIPFFMLLAALIVLGTNYTMTGEIIQTGVTLKGGITITVPTAENPASAPDVQSQLQARFPQNDILVREIAELGVQQALTVEAAPAANQDLEDLQELITTELSIIVNVPSSNYAVEVVGPSLGQSFLQQTLTALVVAFLFMALVVFYYFRTFIPSMAVVLAAFSDMVVTLAVVSLLGMKLGTAGIAAFLMLIGYSVDTDILLSTRVLKRKEGSVYGRVKSAISTGLLMNVTTLAAVVVALVISQSLIIKQIMTILLIGLLVDIINTWIQNAGILRWYAEKKNL